MQKVANRPFSSILSTLLAEGAVGWKQSLVWKSGVLLISLFVGLGLGASPASAQHEVTGEVIDSEEGGTLPGVNIVVKGTQIGAATRSDGTYTIEAPSPADTLVFSFVGYQQQEVPIEERSEIDVALEPAVTALEEVVVQVGYQEQAVETVTGSVSQVSGADLDVEPATNLSSTLQGTIPGVIGVSRGGTPGQDGSNLLIRGASTLNNSSPLVVVDGVPGRRGGLDRLNPDDIQSISVLKDASAAIYGSRAANGVILVTTKRGQAGETRINVGFEQSLVQPTFLPEMVDAPQQMQMMNELAQYRGNPPVFSAEEIEAHRGDQSDSWTRHNTDWYDVAFQDFAEQTEGNVAVTGGSEDVRYRLSFRGLTETGILTRSSTRYNQFDFRSNLDGDVTENLTLSANLYGRLEDRNYPTVNHSGIFAHVQQITPLEPAYWPNGDPAPGIESGVNPVVAGSDITGYDKSDGWFFQSELTAEYNIPSIEGWTIAGTAALDLNFDRQRVREEPWTLYAADVEAQETIPVIGPDWDDPRLTERESNARDILLRGTTTYETSVGNHNGSLLLGSEWQSSESRFMYAFRRFFPTDQIDELFAGGTAQQDINGNSSKARRMNFFGRLNYNYQQRYLLEFVGRYDGSYIFPEDNRFGFFPSVSAGWRLAQEDWFDDFTGGFFDRLKIRGAVGQVGNDRIEPFQFIETYGFAGQFEFGDGLENRLAQQRVANPAITWETATKTDVGLAGAVFGERLSFDLTYFRQFREDILWFRSGAIPRMAGFTLPRENIGEVRSRGIEGEVSFAQDLTSEITLRIGANATFAENEIEFFDEPEGQLPWQRNTGRPMDTRLLYIADGIWRTQDEIDNNPSSPGARPGDIRFRDVNDDGVINSDDRVRREENTQPDIIGAFRLGATIGQLDARLLFQGAAQVRRDISTSRVGDRGAYFLEHFENRWTPDNPDGTWPRAWNRNEPYWVEGGSTNNTFFYQDAKYLRLKSAHIGYTLPENLVPGSGRFQVYLRGRNLLTWTPLEIVDPEMSKGSDYPPDRTFTVGIQMDF